MGHQAGKLPVQAQVAPIFPPFTLPQPPIKDRTNQLQIKRSEEHVAIPCIGFYIELGLSFRYLSMLNPVQKFPLRTDNQAGSSLRVLTVQQYLYLMVLIE